MAKMSVFPAKDAVTLYVVVVIVVALSALTLASSCSEAKPKPKTVLALLSAHWPNFCDVFVKVILGVMVLLMITCRENTIIMDDGFILNTPDYLY